MQGDSAVTSGDSQAPQKLIINMYLCIGGSSRSTVALTEIRPNVQSWRPQLPRPLAPWKWNECSSTHVRRQSCTQTIIGIGPGVSFVL